MAREGRILPRAATDRTLVRDDIHASHVAYIGFVAPHRVCVPVRYKAAHLAVCSDRGVRRHGRYRASAGLFRQILSTRSKVAISGGAVVGSGGA
jgi:hypothetical protein